MLHGAGNMLWHLIETVVMATSKLADSLPLGKPFRFWWQIWNYRTGKLQIEKQFVNRHTACFHRYTGIGGGKKKRRQGSNGMRWKLRSTAGHNNDWQFPSFPIQFAWGELGTSDQLTGRSLPHHLCKNIEIGSGTENGVLLFLFYDPTDSCIVPPSVVPSTARGVSQWCKSILCAWNEHEDGMRVHRL